MNNFEISFNWIAVQSSKNIPYSFPQPITKYLRQQYNWPAIYRWSIKRSDKTLIYIGETERLDRRLNHYLKPGPSQKTNQRLRELFDKELISGASIGLDVLSFESFVINGREYSSEKLWEKEVRCFLENLLITQLPTEIEKLNRLISVQEKIVHRAAKLIRPDLSQQQRAVIISSFMKQAKAAKEESAIRKQSGIEKSN